MILLPFDESRSDIIPKKEFVCQPIPWEDVRKVLNLTDNYKDFLFFGIGFLTGMRASEILNLKWGDIIDEDGQVQPHYTYVEPKKKRKDGTAVSMPRTIYIGKALAGIVAQAYQENKGVYRGYYIFRSGRGLGRNENKPMSYKSMRNRVIKVWNSYDPDMAIKGTHVLRKTAATRTFDLFGRSEDALLRVMKLLNHSSRAMTIRYLGLGEKTQAESYEALNEL